MVKKNKSDNDIREIDNKWEFFAFVFKYRAKEMLAVLLIVAIILNVADINIKEWIAGFFK